MTQSLDFLLSDDAAIARAKERKPHFVVHLEIIAGYDRDQPRFEEIDADSVEHAKKIGHTWKANGLCHSYAVRPASIITGKLRRPIVIR